MCCRQYHFYIYFSMGIFLLRSYIFWLGLSTWLLWMMRIWLPMDLSVFPGRQICLNCCMPLERASLMGLLESQSVSLLTSWLEHTGQPWWCNKLLWFGDGTQEAAAWRNHISFMPLLGRLMSNRDPADSIFYVNVCWVCFCACRLAGLVKPWVWWNATAMHPDSYTD